MVDAPPDHVGVLLLAVLDAMGMSQAELSRRTGVTPKHVNQVCQGVAGISARFAVRLEEVTSVDAVQWLYVQAVHDIAVARAAHRDVVATQRDAQDRAAAVARALIAPVSPTL